MKLQDFIDALYNAGWEAPCDAQHSNIKALWREWFPKDARIAELEKAIDGLETRVDDLIATIQER